MAMASPTPMGSSHFASLSRRPSSRQINRQPPSRPQLSRGEPLESHARHYSMNDSSDDEIPLPMKFSALTKALLNDEASMVEQSPPKSTRPKSQPVLSHERGRSVGSLDGHKQDNSPPGSRVHSPHPRKIILNRSTPGSSSLRRSASVSSTTGKALGQGAGSRMGSPSDLSTPAPMVRTIRLPSGGRNNSGSSSGRYSSKTNSGPKEDADLQDGPTTIAKSTFAASQGSVSRYGTSTIGRTRYGDDFGSTMRPKRVDRIQGKFLSGPARRGRKRLSEEQSPVDDQENPLENLEGQDPPSQESQAPESQESNSGPDSDANQPVHAPAYRDFASGSPISSNDLMGSALRTKSPPPKLPGSQGSKSRTEAVYPAYKVPAPLPNLPSAHDQENEAPPTFKRNKQASMIHLDKLEKVPTRPDTDVLRAVSPDRRPLAPRSQNTPRRPAPPPPPKMSILDAATSTAGAAASHASSKRNKLRVNGKHYTRLDCIGRGGSSRVYRVMAENSSFFALKRVSLDDADEAAVLGFKGEIDLLKKLEGVERVIRLYDFEQNDDKGTLSVLMELGELDLYKMLDLRLKSDNPKFDISFVRYYWKEMLECLKAIHEHDIVHSDLKPQNFVLVRGQLKLIDFGIANAIQTDETINVHRESQVGTPNYMSPESLMDSNAKTDSRGRISNEPKLMKLGKPSDIWSLACILYQMVYGIPPFGHIQDQIRRCQAIINFSYAIEYPPRGVGGVSVPASLIRTLKRCLNRDQHQRPSAVELLDDHDPFLSPVEFDVEDSFPMTEELLGRILQNVATKCSRQMPSDADLLVTWPKGYLGNLRQKLREGRPL